MAHAFALEALPKTTVMVVAGPTASGKSAWAIDQINRDRSGWAPPESPDHLSCPGSGQWHTPLADGWPITCGRIINGDSMQVYQGLDLLTAMPSNEDQAAINHDLYGFLCPYAHQYDVCSWTKNVNHWVHRAHGWGQRVWIVGGTGFYLKTLSDGLSPMPVFSPADKDALRDLYVNYSVGDLKKQLETVDGPSAEKLHDKQRLIHALTVYALTDKPLSWWHQQKRIQSPLTFFRILIWPSRETLLIRAEQRWESMVQQGVYAQVRDFCANPKWQTSPLRHAIGLHPIWEFVQGSISEHTCRQMYLTAIAQYIKQQRTWFRGQFKPDYVCQAQPNATPYGGVL